jgi:transglutaminase-like putative cysteine protease
MRLRITHETSYDYAPVVETAQHITHLRPLTLPTQQLVSHSLDVQPPPAQQMEARDVYGNTRTFFALDYAHHALRVTAHSLVDTTEPAPPPLGSDGSPPWEQVRERFRYRAGGARDAAAEFTFPSDYVPRHEDFVAYARPSFTTGTPLLVAAQDLMQRIFKDFTYESLSTDISTPAVEALAQRKGVCQDFAHIMIACMRAMGLPARYVSGYLLTMPPEGQPRLIGSDASHAWASVYVPLPAGANTGALAGDVDTCGWFDFDPTNNRSPGEDYVTLAIGRDYGDVSPMRGVIHGGARHTLHVGVTVEPMEPGASPAQSQSQNRGQSQGQSQSQSQN